MKQKRYTIDKRQIVQKLKKIYNKLTIQEEQ